MFQSHEKKLIYFTLAILFFFLLVGSFIIIPQYRSIKKMNQSIFELRSTLETKYEKTRRLHKSQLKLVEARQTASDLQSLFIKSGEEINFISSLENLADKFSLEQKLSLSPIYKETGTELNKMNLQITAKGEFKNLMAYFSELDRHAYLISVSEINLSRGTASALILSLKAHVYVRD